MAQTRQQEIKYLLNEHDASPAYQFISTWTELDRLAADLKQYNAEHAKYTAEINNHFFAHLGQAYTNLESFFFPKNTSVISLDVSLKSLFKIANALSAKAVAAREALSLFSDENKHTYEEAAGLLRKIGWHVERKIMATRTYIPIPEEAYLLTALQDSPDVFLAAQHDAAIKGYVKELNDAKRKFPEKSLKSDGSDLADRIAEYGSQLKEVEVKYQTIGSACLQKIRDIEKKRNERWGWGLGNFFVDIYRSIATGESEKDELKRLHNQKQILSALEKDGQRLTREGRVFKFRSELKSLGRQLLTDASRLDSGQINSLRIAILELSSANDSADQIKLFIDELKTVIFNQLESTKDTGKSLAVLLDFLSERLVKNCSELNALREAVISGIHGKLNAFIDSTSALQFIKNLKGAKPDFLDELGAPSKTINEFEIDFQAWSDIDRLGSKLIDGSINPFDQGALQDALRSSVRHALQSTLPVVKQAANDYDEKLRKVILSNITEFQQCSAENADEFARIMGLHLSFYASKEMYTEEQQFAASKNAIRQAILNSIGVLSSKEVPARINKWEKLEPALNAFDSTLYQELQNKKNQYKSFQLLENGWDDLLCDARGSKLTADEADKFIAAVLWLDTPHAESNGIIDLFNVFNSDEQQKFRATAKGKIAELKIMIEKDLADLASQSLSQTKSAALGHRLKFVTKENSMYTQELGKLRSAVIQTINKHLTSDLSIQETRRYLQDLMSVLPEAFKTDAELSRMVLEVKKKVVTNNSTAAQAKLYQKYKDGIDFLRTGDISLWDTIKLQILKIKDVDPHELTWENITYWRRGFFATYDVLRRQTAMAVEDAPYRAGENGEDKKIIDEYLNTLIAEDMKSISYVLVNDLMQKADFRRQQALKKLDKIFGLAPDKPVDINLFTFRYFAMVEYQRHCQSHPESIRVGSDFVRKFHEMAQNSGGFTTQIMAKLPYDALEEMYVTWAQDPDVKMSKDGLSLNKNIIGKVDQSSDTHIQVPQYLMLYMVLELIAADFDSSLRGDKVDEDLSIGRIKFAVPHFKQILDFEKQLNSSKDGIGLRDALLSALQKLNDEQINAEKAELINHLRNTEINILEIVRNFSRDITNKLPEAMADMILQLQYRFSERYRNVMVKLLDQKHINCMDKFVPNGMVEVDQENKQESILQKGLSLAGSLLFQAKKEPVREYKPTAKERVENIVNKLSHDDRREMFKQLLPEAIRQHADFTAASEIFRSSMPINMQRNQSTKPDNYDNPPLHKFR